MKKLSALCLLVILGGCTIYQLAPAGKVDIGDTYSITLNDDWSQSEFKHMRTYTKDGPLLGAVSVTSGVNEDEHLLVGVGEDKQPPYEKNLSLIELQQFITDSFVATGAEKLTVSEIRPESFGSWQGIRAEFDFFTKEGLHKKALIVGAQQNDKLYYILYTAPALHFFDKNKPEVEGIIRSITIKPKA